MSSDDSDRDGQYDSLSGCLLRLFWLMLGNVLLALAILQILFSRPPFFSGVDGFFWLVVGVMIAARFLDLSYFSRTRADGQPATATDGWRYVVILVVAAAIVWMVAHMAAHWLPFSDSPTPVAR